MQTGLMWKTTHHASLACFFCVPETRRCVVQGVHFSLHLVVQDDGTLFQSVAQQVLTHDNHGYSGTTHILLGPGENQPKLHNQQKTT